MWGFAILPFLLVFSLFGIIIPVAIGVFVYKDAEKRRMNGLVWALIVIFVPSFIGLIIYFIVRENESGYECGNCHASVKANQDYCPNCGASLQNRYDLNNDNGRNTGEGRVRRDGGPGNLSPLVILFIVLAVGVLIIFVLLGVFSMRNSISNDFIMQNLLQ